MPSSSELHRVKIGLFHPILIKILIKKEKGQLRRDNKQSIQRICSGAAARGFVSLHADNVLRSFLLAVKCVLLCGENKMHGSQKNFITG